MKGIILKALSGFYYVSDGEKTYECKARGSFRKSGVSPLVGDVVEFEPSADGSGVVTEVLPRKNRLFRPPVANIDKLFIVSSFENPSPNAYLIDKITAIWRNKHGARPMPDNMYRRVLANAVFDRIWNKMEKKGQKYNV